MMKVCVRQEKLLLEKNKRRCFLSYSMRMLVWFFFFFYKKRWDGVTERDWFLDSRQKHLQILLIFAVGSY